MDFHEFDGVLEGTGNRFMRIYARKYDEYMGMSIWDPRYTYCRFLYYRFFDAFGNTYKASRDYASECIANVRDKFYKENYTSRYIKERSEVVCSSFTGKSSVFLFNKISYHELKELRSKVSLFKEAYDDKLPSDNYSIDMKFSQYMNYMALFLNDMWDLKHEELWDYYIIMLNDIETYFLNRQHPVEFPAVLHDIMVTLTEEYYSLIFEEYNFYEDRGEDTSERMPDSLTRKQVELDRKVLLDFLNNPTNYAVNKDKYLQEYDEQDVLLAYNKIYSFSQEDVYMKLERCVNRIEDKPVLIDGLCCYSMEVMDSIYDTASIILELDNDAVVNYSFNFFYLPSESAVINEEYQVYLDNYQQFLSIFRMLYDEKVIDYETLYEAISKMDMEVSDMIVGIKNEITQDIVGDLLNKNGDLKLIEEVREVDGIKLYTDTDEKLSDLTPNKESSTSKKMNLGGN